MDLVIRNLPKADELGLAVTHSGVMVSRDRMREPVSNVSLNLDQCADIWIGDTWDEDRPVIFERSGRILDEINWTTHCKESAKKRSANDAICR